MEGSGLKLLQLLFSPVAVAALACCTALLCAEHASADPAQTVPDGAKAERAGPPTMYSHPVGRYRYGEPNVSDPAFYPVPQDPVTRETYMRCIDAADPAEIARHPDRGMGAPTAFLPVLAKYVQTGDRALGEAIVAALKSFHDTMKREVSEHKWVSEFEFASAYIPIYREYLLKMGILKPDDAWFRDMWLYYCRNLHVWSTEPIEWRGGCHRSIPEAISKQLAAEWYPDTPEAAHWKRYSQLVFGDFWRHKDVPQNDTGYMFTTLTQLACNGDRWTGDDRLYTDPGMKRLWERLIVEVTTDGSVNPYGPNGGWNSTASQRLYMSERLAVKTGDGRYRYVAHKVFNYLRYQADSCESDSYRIDAPHAALAWLFANDSVRPVQPDSGSLWNKRIEAARVPHTDKALTEKLLGNADPEPNKGQICCCWWMTGKEWPDKLILRSGWNPGDLFALVELHPTSFPANPGGIMGLDRWGAPFTQIATSKGGTAENRVLVEDTDHKAKRRYHPDRKRIDENWANGKMPDIRSEVTYFEDTLSATFARVRVENLDGLPVTYEREFVFAKNRFLATREIVTFEESFKARVSSLWNTHNVGPQIGSHWANTFIAAPIGDNGTMDMKTPPADLLVWFAPRKDCRLQVVDRFGQDPRTESCPAQVRYMWEGVPKGGDKVVFTQVYYPHPPYRARTNTNNPIANLKAVYADDLQATACASGIHVSRDDSKATVLRLETEPGRVEWVVFNPNKAMISVGSLETNKPYACISADGPDNGSSGARP